MEQNEVAATPSRGEAERSLMQELLDREFPAGAMAAVVIRDRGRIEPGLTCATGRLVCERSEPDRTGSWWYRIVIDPRQSRSEQAEAHRLWAGPLRRCYDSPNLWEAEVRTDDDTTPVLRLNCNPPAQWRPTKEMRRAVSEAYADLLVPVAVNAQ